MIISLLPTATSVAAGTLLTASPLAITTTFVAPPSCTENHLTMLGMLKDELWLNAPAPVPSSTIGSCYPKEFIDNIVRDDQGRVFISTFDPLVCPENYTIAFSASSGYIACCPSGYGLGNRSDAPLDRPAAGGTCYTDIKMGQTIDITAYDSTTLLGTTTWIATTSGAQAYAYPLDGYRSAEFRPGSRTNTYDLTSVSTPLRHPAPTESSTENLSISSHLRPGDIIERGLSKAARIGIVLGCVIGALGLIIAIVFGLKTLHQWMVHHNLVYKNMKERRDPIASRSFHCPGNVEENVASASRPVLLPAFKNKIESPRFHIDRLFACGSPETPHKDIAHTSGQLSPSSKDAFRPLYKKQLPRTPKEAHITHEPDLYPAGLFSSNAGRSDQMSDLTASMHVLHSSRAPSDCTVAPLRIVKSPSACHYNKPLPYIGPRVGTGEGTGQEGNTFHLESPILPRQYGSLATTEESIDRLELTGSISMNREECQENSGDGGVRLSLYPPAGPEGYWEELVGTEFDDDFWIDQ